MTRDIVPEIHAALREIAPEIDPTAVDPRAILVEALDIDSIDFLRFLEALSGRVGVDIPEADYPQVQTIEALAAYVGARPATPRVRRPAT